MNGIYFINPKMKDYEVNFSSPQKLTQLYVTHFICVIPICVALPNCLAPPVIFHFFLFSGWGVQGYQRCNLFSSVSNYDIQIVCVHKTGYKTTDVERSYYSHGNQPKYLIGALFLPSQRD